MNFFPEQTFDVILCPCQGRPRPPSAAKPDGSASEPESSHFPPTLLYTAARLYYEEDATQAEIADQLGTSRATVSRLLAEAKRQGIVRIEVVPRPMPGPPNWPTDWPAR